MTATRATVEFLISRIIRLSPWLLLLVVPLSSVAAESPLQERSIGVLCLIPEN